MQSLNVDVNCVYTDMINMLKLTYVGRCCCWIFSPGDAVQAIAV